MLVRRRDVVSRRYDPDLRIFSESNNHLNTKLMKKTDDPHFHDCIRPLTIFDADLSNVETAPPKCWYTRKQVADYYSLSTRQLNNLIRLGKFPRQSCEFGKKHLWHNSVLERFDLALVVDSWESSDL